MSLLTRGRHTVHVQNRVMSRNAGGLRVPQPVGEPIPVRCTVEPVRDWSSAEEQREGGLQILDLLIVRAQNWPGDVLSLVEHEGKWYETVGAPQHHSAGRRTQHWRVTLRWLKGE